MALNHFRASHFRAKHLTTLGALVSVVFETIKKLPYWVKTARGRGKVINSGDRFYYKSK